MKLIICVLLAGGMMGCKDKNNHVKVALDTQMEFINDSADKSILPPFKMPDMKNIVTEKP